MPGSLNAIEGYKDLVFDFTTYTDKDVCLGLPNEKIFRMKGASVVLIVMLGLRLTSRGVDGRND